MAKDKTTTLYLLRHGQTEDNVRRIIQGQNDSPLTQEGINTTKSRAEKLKDVTFDAIFCSDLERAKKSLVILLGELDSNINVNYCKEIRELDFGQLTGKNIDDVKDVILFHKRNTWKHYPDGENGDSFSKRVINFVDKVLDEYSGKTLLFMTHYGVIETILKYYVPACLPGSRQGHPSGRDVEKLGDRLNTKNYDIWIIWFNHKGVRFTWL